MVDCEQRLIYTLATSMGGVCGIRDRLCRVSLPFYFFNLKTHDLAGSGKEFHLERCFRCARFCSASKKSLRHSSHEHRDLLRKNLYIDLTDLSHFRE
jgi:hypothetical protein